MSWLARLKSAKSPEGDATKATKPVLGNQDGRSVAFVAPALAAVALPGNDPDAYCWPHSAAMNGAEIDLFTGRLHRFTNKGLSLADGEAPADKLVIRDRDTNDRRLCLECQHLQGFAPLWGCGNWQRAGVATCARDAGLPSDFVQLLQRCDGFMASLKVPVARSDRPP